MVTASCAVQKTSLRRAVHVIVDWHTSLSGRMKPLALLVLLLVCLAVCLLTLPKMSWPTQHMAHISVGEVAATDVNVTKETHDKGDIVSLVRARQHQKPNNSNGWRTPMKVNTTLRDSDEPRAHSRPHRRYLIYLCDDMRSCGGWGDRQRGMVAAYLLARVTGRHFGINMSHPCDIKMFYTPNMVNWYVKVKDIRGLNWEIVDWMDNSKDDVDVESDFNIKHPSDVIFLKTNRDIINSIRRSSRYGRHVPKTFKDKTRAKVFQTIWQLLMKKSFHFEEHLDRFMSRVSKKTDLVCAHVRMRKNPNMPNDASQINALSSVDSLWRFLSKFRNTSRIFVASDSLDVRNSARKWFGDREIDTDGVVLHIDRQGHVSSACIGLEMALLDQVVLSLCKVLVVSTSNFSIRGAMMSQLKQKLFIFKNGTISTFNLK